jgi:hypothetical protein
MMITARKIKPFVYLLLLTATIASWGWTFLFLYKYFYQAMAQTEKIYILRRNIGMDVLDTGKFQQAIDKMDQKTKTKIDTSKIQNPF